MSRPTAHRTVATITIKDQLASFYRRAIDEGRFKHDSRMPSRRQVADEWGVAIGTVTKVFHQLNAEGYVRSLNGDGTYAVGPEHRQKVA